jgi:translation initiation factor 1
VPEDDPFEGLDVPDDPTADLDRAPQQLSVRTEERRYDKPVTVVEGFEGSTDLPELASQLKSAVGAGGTVKDDAVEVGGDHRERVRELLEEKGLQVA